MLKIEKTVLPSLEQWEIIIEGMRNPMNSWELSDSTICLGADGFEDCTISISGVCPRHEDFRYDVFCMGEKDHKLMTSLANGGAVHAKYRRMIPVFLTINAPLYWWKEFDTYKVGTVANSCSTMHKIHSKEFTLDDFSHEQLVGLYAPGYSEAFIDISDEYDEHGKWCSPLFVLEEFVIKSLNANREMFLETKDKKYWWQIIQLLPTSYNQKRTVMLNYEVLVNIYHSRKNHKLDEWHTFCDWIKELPYSELITGEKSK
jgi:hypothetical protein